MLKAEALASRLLALLTLSAGIASSAAASEPEASGTLVGVVTGKGQNWIVVKPEQGASERFMARWIGGPPDRGGGLDKEIVAKIARVKEGDKVEVKWIMDERKRVVGLTVLEGAGHN